MRCFLRAAAVLCLFLSAAVGLRAEAIKDLPAPTGYVSDFAGVLNPATREQLEELCTIVDRQAHAQIAVVTIHTLDNDQSIEEAATELEEKWKVGAKGTDRGVLMLLVMQPRRGRIEVGYGLEGILNDAKVGDIGRSMTPYAQQGDYDRAVSLGVGQIARIIADDAHITLQPMQHTYRRVPAQQQPVSLLQVVVVGGGLILLVVFLASTGNLGILWFILGSLMGGGGGRRGDDDRRGGGFGGFGGGGSGGGGASGDF